VVIAVEEPRVQSGVRTLTEIEAAWLAGVVDGEGSILIGRIAPKRGHYRRGFYYRANLEIANSNELFLRRVLELIGKGSVALNKEKNPRWKDKWQYTGTSNVLKIILPQVLPYLVVKKKVAEKMLEYLAFVDANPIDGPMQVPIGFDEKRDTLYLEIKKLNKRGPGSTSDSGESTPLPEIRKARGRGVRATNCRTLREAEKAWLAAIIDGEGTITLVKRIDSKYRRGFCYVPTLEISNTNKALLIRIWELIGEGGVYTDKRETPGWKRKWMYNGSAGVLRAILPQILPYLIVKKGRAEKMLEYLQYVDANPILGLREIPQGYYTGLDAVFLALKKLNQKGRGAGIL
jgi:branched-subunit amino acid transport protein AzlD